MFEGKAPGAPYYELLGRYVWEVQGFETHLNVLLRHLELTTAVPTLDSEMLVGEPLGRWVKALEEAAQAQPPSATTLWLQEATSKLRAIRDDRNDVLHAFPAVDMHSGEMMLCRQRPENFGEAVVVEAVGRLVPAIGSSRRVRLLGEPHLITEAVLRDARERVAQTAQWLSTTYDDLESGSDPE